jgi:uncharacterized protein involved in exopolysaccharide biosynthesis
MMHEPQHHTLSKTELIALVRKYHLLVLTVFVIGTVAMWVALSVFFTEFYATKTKLLVKVGRENVETPATVQHGQVISQGVRVADINSEVQLLTSQALAEIVVDRLGTDAFKSVLASPTSIWQYPKYLLKRVAREARLVYKEFLILTNIKKRLDPREEAILAVVNGVKAEPIRDSDILVVTVRTPSPRLCVDVSNVLLDAYLHRRVELRQPQAGSAFFRSRLEEASQKVLELQRVRATVRQRWDIAGADEQRTSLLDRLALIEKELVQNQAEIAGSTSQLGLMINRVGELADLNRKEQVEARNPAIGAMEDRLAALRVEEAKISSRYVDGSEAIEKVRTEIRSLGIAIEQVRPTIISSVTSENNILKRDFGAGIEQQRVRISGLESRNRYLRSAALDIHRDTRNLSEGTDEVQNAEREFQRAEQDYLFYSKRLEEARMSEQLDAQQSANVTMVAPPETPIEPVAPNKLFLIEIAMAVSLVLGIACAALVETLEDRIFDERSVAAVGDVPYLGTVSV